MEHITNNQYEFEDQFFFQGIFVALKFLESCLFESDPNKTVHELKKEKRLLNNEQYAINPAFLISCLYGLFLLYREHFEQNDSELDESKEQIKNKINKIMSEHFKVIKGEKENLWRSIRNSLAHYRIQMLKRDDDIVIVFRDRKNKSSSDHFIAEISFLGLRLVIEELSQLLC